MRIYLWRKAPFVRLLMALAAGIILQWHLQLSLFILLLGIVLSLGAALLHFFISIKWAYRFRTFNGLAINILLVLLGAVLVWVKDVRHEGNWIGRQIKEKEYIVVTLREPLVEKANTYKALARVENLYVKNSFREASGKIILYFKKDPLLLSLRYGSQIIFSKPLQEIKNAGNPGSFDYKQYSLFQGITHQAYLKATDFQILSTEKKDLFGETIFSCRKWVLNVLQRFIPGEKEQGLAEALLIGYKDDLDKNLVQSYSNTGVVHIIAISGLHLGLIYWLLLQLTKPLKRNKSSAWLRLVIIVASLWMFSLLAGGQPSVLRSAVMFSCIAFGEVIARRGHIYNTLALSAFLLLCYNPYWLWDVGFQLSYAAVLSIVIFFRPIYNWYRPQNKFIDWIWKLNAVTLAAQLLTLPISVYHFHQIPTLFLLTNLLAVPLSSGILIAEILLCALFFFESVANFLGWVLQGSIWFMNTYVERLDSVSFATWGGLSISILQAIMLTAAIVVFCFGLMEKQKELLWLSASCLLVFLAIRSFSFIDACRQKKLIVYNVPGHQAIDLVDGRTLRFMGDADLLEDDFIRNFHIQPSRVLHRIALAIPVFTKEFDINNKNIALLDTTTRFAFPQQKPHLDVLILSKNPRLYISDLNRAFTIGQIVIDGSVPAWKAGLWKKDCESLRIPCHDVSEKGAFVMNL
jgi:competence protein ComEC